MRSSSEPEAALRIRGVRKAFGSLQVLQGIDLEIGPCMVTAIVGPNGAGKTTLFHAITGDVQLDSGDVFLGDRSITGVSPWRIARAGLGKLFQDVRVFDNLSVRDNVVVALDDSATRNPLWPFLHLISSRRLRRRTREAADVLLRQAGVDAPYGGAAHDLSYGNQKLLAFARLLAGDFKVLLLDEPTSGLSATAAARLGEHLRTIAHERRIAVALIEHNLSFVEEYADKVYVLQSGQVIGEGPPREVLEQPGHRELLIGL